MHGQFKPCLLNIIQFLLRKCFVIFTTALCINNSAILVLTQNISVIFADEKLCEIIY